MKLGVQMHALYFLQAKPELYKLVALKAEALGFESLWLGDHVMFPAMMPPDSYQNEGVPVHDPGMHRMDPLVTLGYLAGVTSRIRLGTAVYLAALRNPFITARAVTSLDLLSSGRTILGLGAGWLREEFELLGEEYHTRGKRMDEVIEILRCLWTQETTEFHGTHYSFGPVRFEPKAWQRRVPPILLGGDSDAALDRAARLGDGWIAPLDPATRLPYSPTRIAAAIDKLNGLRTSHGLSSHAFEISLLTTLNPKSQFTLAEIDSYQAVGVDRIILAPWAPVQRPLTEAALVEGMHRFSYAVLSRLDQQ